MKRFFVEDAAHEAILKILNFHGPEIRRCSGRSKTITLAIHHINCVGLIDRDNAISHPELKDGEWNKKDDFDYLIVKQSLLICFTSNVEFWLVRIAKTLNVEPLKF